MGIFRQIVRQQMAISKYFDEKCLPKRFLIDGNSDYLKSFVPDALKQVVAGSTIYDIGCGKNPALTVEDKRRLDVKVIGIDLSVAELGRAPAGAMDRCIGANICDYRGDGDGDLLFCQALLEHVPDVAGAFASMASILRKGGVALIFVPSRNAVFARLNIMLPQRVKLKLLHGIFPSTRRDQGFPSFYDRCTPRDFRDLAALHGFAVEEVRTYYKSSYFSFFFPLYLVWRLWIVLFERFRPEQAAETFCMRLRRA